MYYPYFRGKQFDLITLRENADLLAKAGFVPIVEPVKEVLSGLTRSVEAINNAGGELILIVNPSNGDHSENSDALNKLLQEEFKEHVKISPGVLLTEGMSLEKIAGICNLYKDRLVTLIHNGFVPAKALAEQLGRDGTNARHVFIEDQCGLLYRKHFVNAKRILVRNGFKRRANREHPVIEKFSDLHVTYDQLGMDGFGDYLIVGDEYSTTGGPAYAVAIHLTCIDPETEDVMFIHHFKSIRFDTPTDPAGKFAEAAQKLADEVNRPGTCIRRTKAVVEFLSLHASGHFPGLGYVKKLTMDHHIETLAAYFQKPE